MKKSYILGSFIVCFLALLCSCTHVTDDTEHTSDFYVFNMTGEVLDVEFVDYKDKKLILTSNDKYYEIKMYSQKEIIEKGKKYLESINNE